MNAAALPLPLVPSGLLVMPPLMVAQIALLARTPGLFSDAPTSAATR